MQKSRRKVTNIHDEYSFFMRVACQSSHWPAQTASYANRTFASKHAQYLDPGQTHGKASKILTLSLQRKKASKFFYY